MGKYIYDESNGLWYARCGDYYLPCPALPEQKSISKCGQKKCGKYKTDISCYLIKYTPLELWGCIVFFCNL